MGYMTTGTNKTKLYLVNTPPPTLSGKLYIGHIFGYSQAQYILNFKRIMEYKVINDKELRGAKRLRTKLVNAARFIDLQIEEGLTGRDLQIEEYAFSKIKSIKEHITKFNIVKAKEELHILFWDEFCSTGIEQSKQKPITVSLSNILRQLKPLLELQLTN